MLSVGQFFVGALLVALMLMIAGLSVGLYLYLRRTTGNTATILAEYSKIMSRHTELLSAIYEQQGRVIAASKADSVSVLRTDEDEREYQAHLTERGGAGGLRSFMDMP